MKTISINPQVPKSRIFEVAQSFEIYLTRECKTMRHVRVDPDAYELLTSRALSEKEKNAIRGIESAIINTI